jgi:hypothetical protein
MVATLPAVSLPIVAPLIAKEEPSPRIRVQAPVHAPFLEQRLAVAAALGLDPRQFACLFFGVSFQPCDFGEPGAVGFDHLCRLPGDIGEVMEFARRIRQVFARQRQAHEIGRAAGQAGDRARREQPPERGPAGFQRPLLGAPALGKLSDGGAHRARFGFERLQRAVGIGDRALGVAQGVARLAPVGFPAFEFGAERFDPRAQGGQVFFACRTGARAGRAVCQRSGARERRSDEEDCGGTAAQVLAFPCAETAAMRLATSAGSPR